MNPGDWANIVTAFCAVIATFFGFFTFNRQKTSADVSTILSIFDRINGYWDKYTCENESQNRDYNMGQILSYFENACYLINKSVVNKSASICIEDHIFEIWSKLNENESGREYINRFISSPTTFCELKEFTTGYMKRKPNSVVALDSR